MRTSLHRWAVPLAVALVAAFSAASAVAAPPAYYPSGPQTSVATSALTGWTKCFEQTYDQFSPSVASILAACQGDYMMLGGRPTADASTWTVLAAAPRADVITDTGSGNTPHDANGTGWYFNDSYSVGLRQGRR